MNSRSKGKRGELELCKWLRDNWDVSTRRGQQFCGANGDADVVGLPGLHIECKRVEALNVSNAIRQAVTDARKGETPVVFHRRNNDQWLITIRASDAFEFAECMAGVAGRPFFPRGDQ